MPHIGGVWRGFYPKPSISSYRNHPVAMLRVVKFAPLYKLVTDELNVVSPFAISLRMIIW